jgi:uncharacterized phage protein gp47/JayE
MAFTAPTLDELIARISSDLVTRLGLSGAVLRRSVVGVIARVLAGAAYLLHAHLEYLGRQLFPDTSELAFLERQASLYGLTRIPAAFADGTLTATGIDGTIVPSDTRWRRADGAEYATTGSATIASGTATLTVVAVLAGEAGNADIGVSLTAVSPIAGLTATAVVATALGGGADAESDAALRDRLMARMRQPPQGGAAADYIAWALEVAGVTRAWVYPLELGAGTVTVRFVRDGDGSLIPDSGEVADVQAHIDVVRPVTAAVTVVAPTAVSLDFTIEITPDTADTRAAVEAELANLILRVGAPGAPLLRSQMLVAIGTAAGITDFTLTTPAADVTHTAGQLPTLGTITWV